MGGGGADCRRSAAGETGATGGLAVAPLSQRPLAFYYLLNQLARSTAAATWRTACWTPASAATTG